MNILITGGAGFIGSNFVHWLIANKVGTKVVVLDSLTYAGNLGNIAQLASSNKITFVRGSIEDPKIVERTICDFKIEVIVNFAAESHVDRSIVDSSSFIRTNIEGTQNLLDNSRKNNVRRFIHISTDEVYGSIAGSGRFTETSPLEPTSPYAASKASSDLLALAAYRTHKLDVVITRCSNNYGPFQFPEKLIPLFITNALIDEPLPLYGNGENVRSWLHVEDHCRAISLVIDGGRTGEVYNIGGSAEFDRRNIDVTNIILKALNKPESLVRRVQDRLGHDLRYAIDYTKINQELGWEPKIPFDQGIQDTIKWYIDNQEWWKSVKSGEYENFYSFYYGDRIKQSNCGV